MIFSAIAQNIENSPAAKMRAGFALLLLLSLASCASSGAREAEIAAEQAAVAAAEQETVRMAQQQAEMKAAEMQRAREAEEAEKRRLQAQAEQRAEQERARAEQARLAQQQAERAVRERQAAIAARTKAKEDRIAELESLLAEVESATQKDEATAVMMGEAVAVSEDLLDALSDELAKYDETDESGNTLVPLAKDRITELEARKNDLMRQIGAQ